MFKNINQPIDLVYLVSLRNSNAINACSKITVQTFTNFKNTCAIKVCFKIIDPPVYLEYLNIAML